jgi:hypothetical protein
MKQTALTHQFVDFIPNVLENGMVYVCIQYATAVHKCCCGCGREVVTPLSPTDWKLIFDGDTISLDPSIGNWNFPCQSHYWIRRNKILWARKWSRREIEAGRVHEQLSKEKYFGATSAGAESGGQETQSERSLWEKVKKSLGW